MVTLSVVFMMGYARADWWDQNGGTRDSTSRPPVERPEAKAEPLDDIRPDATPWRSDIMLDAMIACANRTWKLDGLLAPSPRVSEMMSRMKGIK